MWLAILLSKSLTFIKNNNGLRKDPYPKPYFINTQKKQRQDKILACCQNASLQTVAKWLLFKYLLDIFLVILLYVRSRILYTCLLADCQQLDEHRQLISAM